MDEFQDFCNEYEGDNRLKNWDKWLNVYKKQYANLETMIHRNPKSLLMNRFINEQRYINQEKRFMGKAKHYIKGDHYRGHPDFWKFPDFSKRTSTNLPPCFVVGEYDRSKPDPAPPSPEFICTPDKILLEQGIKDSGSISIKKWKESYIINKELAKVQANTRTKIHRPMFEDLIVFGRQIHQYNNMPYLGTPESQRINLENNSDFEYKNAEYISKQNKTKDLKKKNTKYNNIIELEHAWVCIKFVILHQPEYYKNGSINLIEGNHSFINNVEKQQEKVPEPTKIISELTNTPDIENMETEANSSLSTLSKPSKFKNGKCSRHNNSLCRCNEISSGNILPTMNALKNCIKPIKVPDKLVTSVPQQNVEMPRTSTNILVFLKSLEEVMTDKQLKILKRLTFETLQNLNITFNSQYERKTEMKNKKDSNKSKIENILEHCEITLLYGNCEINHRYERVLELINYNQASIRYKWKLLQNEIKPFTLSRSTPMFFFNRNSGVIGPNGSIAINVNFKSKRTGTFKETWELLMDPPTANGKHCLIHFEAIVLNLKGESNWKYIEKYLDNCIKNLFAREEVNTMLKQIHEETSNKFSYCNKLYEEEVFHHNNPNLFYQSNSVQVLKDLNKTLTLSEWDFSVENLRDNILKLESPELRGQYLESFSKQVNFLLKPTKQIVLNNKKYKSVYEILCSLAENIEDEGIFLKKQIGVTEKVCKISILDFKHLELQGEHSRHNSRKSTSNSLRNSLASLENKNKNTESDFKTEQYIQAFYIKTYKHLSSSIEEISVNLQSISLMQKKSIYSSLGK